MVFLPNELTNFDDTSLQIVWTNYFGQIDSLKSTTLLVYKVHIKPYQISQKQLTEKNTAT
jgi:hypothetical protein